LNQYGESEEPFQLKLLKDGKTIVENFRPPQKIWDMKNVERDVDHMVLRLHHGTEANLQLESAKYAIKATYSMVDSEGATIRDHLNILLTMLI